MAGAISALVFLGSAVVLFLARLGVVDPTRTSTFLLAVGMWASGTIVVIWAAYRLWGREFDRAEQMGLRVRDLEAQLQPGLAFGMDECCIGQGQYGPDVSAGVVNKNPKTVRGARAYITCEGYRNIPIPWAGMGRGETVDVQEGPRHFHTYAFAGVGKPGIFIFRTPYTFVHVPAGRYIVEVCVTAEDVRSTVGSIEIVFTEPQSLSARLISTDEA